MGSLVAAADVLVSPRIKGVNTPMKIYAYLNSGKPILATDIESHSQVLDAFHRGARAARRRAIRGRHLPAGGRCPGCGRSWPARAAVVAREKYSQEAFAATVRRFTRPHRVADGGLSQPCSTYQRAVCARPLSFEWRQA